MNKFALLVGNGINNVTPGFSWDDLLQKLKGRTNGSVHSRIDKPFPLEYEEIYLSAISTVSNSKEAQDVESDLKECVAHFSKNIAPGEIHREICKLGASHILTTNYDFSLQKSMLPDFDGKYHDGYIKETKFNLFRKYHTNFDVTFWHIHGVDVEPATITLGYEHYIGYSQKLRDYVVNGTDSSYRVKYQSLVSRLLNGKSLQYDSWTEILFTHDTHIFGLGLSFVEVDLWWILNYRARRISDGIVNNKIFYYYRRSERESNLAKYELLESFGVELICFSSDGTEFYENVLKKIKEYENFKGNSI